MRIIIIGCGKTGLALAESLNKEGHDIVVIDTNATVVRDVASSLDVMGINGNGVIHDVQIEAGVKSADILIATTGSDEINMLCCMIANEEGDHLHTIARIRDPEYDMDVKYIRERLNIGHIINPDKMTAQEIIHLLNFPSALEIDTFARGTVDMIKMKLPENSPLCGHMLKELPKISSAPALICIIERGSQVIIPDGDTYLLKNDMISIVAKPLDAVQFCRDNRLEYARARSAMVVGGSRITYYIAQILKRRRSKLNLKIIELSEDRAVQLSDEFPEATVIHGDGSDHRLLLEEGIEAQDAFVALTNIDEENMIMSMLASRIEGLRLITKINRMQMEDFSDIEMPLGSIVTPKKITSEEVVRYVRSFERSIGSNMENLFMVADDRAEACEFLVKDDERIVDIPLQNLHVKKNVIVAAIVRNNSVISPHGSDVMKVNDRVVIITTNSGLHDLRDILAR
ncbi:MAG: Trk system potassium transporter TrkA [Lachnospiraceae bacterium]|nr:Trk system potassium transporter TrkA [Lachnospiraceae bacterium]